MWFFLFFGQAYAMTLAEAVQRAAEVNPDSLISALEAERSRLDVTTSAFSHLGTPSALVSRKLAGQLDTTSSSIGIRVPIVDVASWFDTLSLAAKARERGWNASATTLDAQYATAAMYYDVLAAQAQEAAVSQNLAAAQVTATAVQARVAAGLESELVARSARLGVLDAQAQVAQAQSARVIAFARLRRALEEDVPSVEAPGAAPDLPADVSGSPALKAADAALTTVRLAHGSSVAKLFPTATFGVSTTLLPTTVTPAFTDWTLNLGGTWRFDGLVGPVIGVRQAGIDERIAEIQVDALRLDLGLALEEARSEAGAADRVAEAALEREQLAVDSLGIGQTRLAAGLASSIEVLRLQDDAAGARAARVSADLQRILARLEARRVAGLEW